MFSKNLKMLLAEDGFENQNSLCPLLKNLDVEPVVADGLDALNKTLLKDYFDILVLNLAHNHDDYYSLISNLRKYPLPVADIKVLAIIDPSGPADISKLYLAGVDEYLENPVTLNVVGMKLKLMLQKGAFDVNSVYEKNRNNCNYEHIHLGYLKTIAGEQNDFVKQVLTVFKQDVPVQLAEMESAIVLKNYEKAKKIAHYIRTSFMYLGLRKEERNIFWIEKNISIETGGFILRFLLPDLKESVNLVLQEVTKELENLEKQLV